MTQDLATILSTDRFARYLAWANNDEGRALELYTLNVKLSESLYLSLHALEIALRNRIHFVMSEVDNEGWLLDEANLLVEQQRDQVLEAKEGLQREGKELTSGRVLAAVSFSFWTSMFAPPYDSLWQTTLHKIGKREDGKGLRRKDFSTPLATIRLLRNRVAHHEPIIYWDLEKHHAKIRELTRWLAPAAADWCDQHCRFSALHPGGKIALHQGDRQPTT